MVTFSSISRCTDRPNQIPLYSPCRSTVNTLHLSNVWYSALLQW